MLGSAKKGIDNVKPQDYRKEIADLIKQIDRGAEIVEPWDHVAEVAQINGTSLEGLHSDDKMVRTVFTSVVDLVKGCDVIISFLPEASMGSAIELWEAQKAGVLILTVSPMTTNWAIRSVTDHNFLDLEDLKANLAKYIGK
eukprot:TRINITY_DN112910_c0_g1_i1.p1 TRINITY_DN112910_c0_g1~~TRINITY_DN112910_c0_g1_i1.p1  ORF type:complete len:141 (-),score=26.07 TRINITY_DN112910_c0_g1_i1:62-484(-)